MNYRKKGSLVNAVLYTGHNGDYLKKWSGGVAVECPILEPTPENPTGVYMQLINPASTGARCANVGDWILRDEAGHYQSLPHQIFLDTYDICEPA